ncbi:MAG: hypothetical protein WBG19_02475 [Thermoplasmata archaeon]
MPPKPVDPPPRPRRRLGRWPLIAICTVGAIAVILIATTHPWWTAATPEPTITLTTMSISFTGSGSGAVKATSVCAGHCPVLLSVGGSQTLTFTVTPDTAFTNCDPSVYYTVTKVTETTTGGAFPIAGVTADSGRTSLPVTIPNPVGSTTCVTTAQIWVDFNVVDQGPSSQTPALKVTVIQS